MLVICSISIIQKTYLKVRGDHNFSQVLAVCLLFTLSDSVQLCSGSTLLCSVLCRCYLIPASHLKIFFSSSFLALISHVLPVFRGILHSSGQVHRMCVVAQLSALHRTEGLSQVTTGREQEHAAMSNSFSFCETKYFLACNFSLLWLKDFTLSRKPFTLSYTFLFCCKGNLGLHSCQTLIFFSSTM
jgi:hypothetical protein